MKHRGSSLEYASPRLQADKEVVLEAMNQNLESLMYASDELQNDLELLIKIKLGNLTPHYFNEQWLQERMHVLSILEDEAWMKKHNSVIITQKTKTRKF